jgi:hypothetical protein
MKRMALCVVFSLISCTVGPTVPKGQITVQGRGAEALTNNGDPLMNDQAGARKVSLEFAKGYTKGIADQVKRAYWAQQENQRSKQEDVAGRIHYYNATIPEHEDSTGVLRVTREVTIPIIE